MSCQLSILVMLCSELLSFTLPPQPHPTPTPAGPGPTQEELRRRVENGVKEFWYFVRSEVKKLANVEPNERQKYADTLLQDLGHQERCAYSCFSTWEVVTSGHVKMACRKPLHPWQC